MIAFSPLTSVNGRFIKFLFALGLFICSFSIQAQDMDFPDTDPSLWGEEETIYSATKYITQLKKAPVIASVITADQIERMGARTLLDIIKYVPGIGVSIDTSFGAYNIESRGAKNNHSDNVLVLVDGHAINDLYYGSGMFTYFETPAFLIKRVEVIRSPGSALYGTGAFGAVINIITKDNIGIDETQMSFVGGTPSHAQGGLLLNRDFGGVKLNALLHYVTRRGTDEKVEQDALNRSGNILYDSSRIDANVKVNYRDFSGEFGFVERLNGPYIGVNGVLNEGTRQRSVNSFVNLQYRYWESENLQFTYKAYYDRFLYRTNWELFPAGTLPTIDQRIYGQPHADTIVRGGEVQLDYTLSDVNLLTLGINYEERILDEVSRHTNFNPLTFELYDTITDVSSFANFATEETQYISALYAQNILYLTPDLSWTLGGRYDEYSNFGGTFNPRTAFVWDATEKTTLKFLYGTAFRAPNFLELYITNNVVLEGNKDLKPETSETYEVSLNHVFNDVFSSEVNLFHTDIEDLIIQVPAELGKSQYTNKGGLNIEGVELEVKAQLGTSDYAYANYTFQNPRDSETGSLHPGISRHKANAGVNTEINNHINLNANVSASGRRSRASGDGRDPLDKYAVVDASVILKNYTPGVQSQLTVHNLFNKSYFDPDEEAVVASDFPRPGRTVLLGVKITM